MSKHKTDIRGIPLKTSEHEYAGAFITWNASTGEGQAEMLEAAAESLRQYTGMHHAVGRDQYRTIDNNTSVRDEFRRSDYNYFRPSERVPKKAKDGIGYCMEAYRKIGLIRNVIDLMSDFGTQGIDVVHPNRQIQKFYRAWFKKVNGPERSERFLNMLYRCGNIIVKRAMAKLNTKAAALLKAAGADLLEPDSTDIIPLRPRRNTLPIRYDFLNPVSIEIGGGELAQFTGQQVYMLTVTNSLKSAVLSPKTEAEKEMVASLPPDVVRRIKNGDRFIPLDPNKIRVFHYKKDDWAEWADSMIYAILDDLMLLEKMKLADLAALDGAISQIRLWKLGDLEKGLFPGPAAISKLAEILLSNPGGGAFDIIWGPDLKVEEYKTNVHKFLGNEKYSPVLNSIYAGLGVPPTLTGTSEASGQTNNFISLKTLIQRLEYGRMVLKAFWEYELELVRQSMGFRLPAEIRFDRMILTDESAEKAILIQLWDRNLVSTDTIVERCGEMPNLERLRNVREDKERKNGELLPKASQWHNPEKMHELIKIALQRTLISPKESGIEVKEAYKKPPFLVQLESGARTGVGGGGNTPNNKNVGKPGQGRPKTSKDSYQRNRKYKIRTSADQQLDSMAGFLTMMQWAKEAIGQIGDIIIPGILEHYNKKSLRELTLKETEIVESLKFSILANVMPYSPIDADIVAAANKPLPQEFGVLFNEIYSEVLRQSGKTPTIDELRNLQASTYSLIYGVEDGSQY